MEMTDLARRICKDYTEVRPCCVEGSPDAHTVWLVVGVQQFCVTHQACDTLEEAQWMRGMLAKALDTAFRSVEAGYKQSEIAALAWAAACKWQKEQAGKEMFDYYESLW